MWHARSSSAGRLASARLVLAALRVAMLALAPIAGCVESEWTRCIDGAVCPPGQSCDLENRRCGLPGADCFGQPDGLPCEGGAKLCDQGSCVSSCSDDVRNGDDQCTGTDFGGLTCADFDTYGGQLACTNDCRIDSTGCSGACGDGHLDPERELCDPTDFDASAAPTCVSVGLDAGRRDCRADCSELTSDPCMLLGWTYESSEEAATSGVFVDLWGASDVLVALVNPGGVRSASLDGTSTWEPVGVEGASIIGTAVWASSSRDIWVLVDGATFRRWDGERWTTEAAPMDGLIDLWGSSATDLYAVGREGIIHHDGERWSVERRSPGEELRAVWGASSDLVYAVGRRGVILRRDSRGWRAIDSGTADLLVGVWADQGGDLWTISASSVRRLERRGWRTMATFEPDGNGLAWIGGTGAHDMWTSAGLGGAVRHFDGASWSTLRDPDQSTPQALWVDTHAVAVGHQTDQGAVGLTRWFGAGAGPLLVRAGDFVDVWGSGPDDWIAVGTSDGQGIARHADGRTFPFEELVDRVTGFDDGRAYLIDRSGTFWGWDGDAWTIALPSTGAKYHDLWTSGPDLYALFEYDDRTAHVIRFDGERWTTLPALDPLCGQGAVAGWSSGPDDVFVVGNDLLVRWDGSRWTCHDGPELAQPYFSVWGSGPGDVWVYQGIGGEYGQPRLHHWDGAGWTDQVTSGVGTLVGTASDDVFLGGSMHFDGRAWTPLRVQSIPGVVTHATPSRLFSTSPVFESGGVGQFVRTRFWNGRPRELDCGDRVDDDRDGRTDGDDSDCARGAGQRR